FNFVVSYYVLFLFFFFFNLTAPTQIYTLSLHDALPISSYRGDLLRWRVKTCARHRARRLHRFHLSHFATAADHPGTERNGSDERDRKSTRLNSSHSQISYAVFCLKKKKKKTKKTNIDTK